MTTIADRRVTPEDLLTHPDGKCYELVDGKLVERNMGWKSSWVAGNLFGFLATHCKEHGLGWLATSNASYQCYPGDPGKVRRPDLSFIRLARLAPECVPEGHCRIAPDLAVEVISPGDTYYEVEQKVAEYLEAGVRSVWVIDPHNEIVRTHRPGRQVRDLARDDTLEGEDVVPGFAVQVAELFRTPAPPST